jgi:hypothetical protein
MDQQGSVAKVTDANQKIQIAYVYYGNLEDPNDRGYDAIRRLLLLAMGEVLRPRG